jgi:hypothetical protein
MNSWVGEFDIDFLVVSSTLIISHVAILLTHISIKMSLITLTCDPTHSQQSTDSSPSHKPAMA